MEMNLQFSHVCNYSDSYITIHWALQLCKLSPATHWRFYKAITAADNFLFIHLICLEIRCFHLVLDQNFLKLAKLPQALQPKSFILRCNMDGIHNFVSMT